MEARVPPDLKIAEACHEKAYTLQEMIENTMLAPMLKQNHTPRR